MCYSLDESEQTQSCDVCPLMCALWPVFESQPGASCRATVNEAAESQKSSSSRKGGRLTEPLAQIFVQPGLMFAPG